MKSRALLFEVSETHAILKEQVLHNCLKRDATNAQGGCLAKQRGRSTK